MSSFTAMNQPPPFYIRACLLILCFISDYEYISSKQGRRLVLHKEYTFGFTRSNPRDKTTYWQCTSRRPNCYCKAKLVFDAHGNIISGNPDHSHLPPLPRLLVKDGKYVRV